MVRDGEQIVPRDWITASITPDATHLEASENRLSDSHFGYGIHWWIPPELREYYLAKGIYGQFIYINPKQRVVIVKSSAYIKYNIDGTEKSLETLEVFRTISRNIY